MPESDPMQKPVFQLLKLGLFVAIGMIITLVASLVIILATQGFKIFEDPTLISNFQNNVSVLNILLVLQQILVFLLPAMVFVFTQGSQRTFNYQFNTPKLAHLIVVFLLMACATPILGLITEWNANMEFPPFLKAVENWMREKENDAAATTELILRMKNRGRLFVNLFVVALVPAICEEFIFRGALQGIFIRLFKNKHIAIWSGAIVFSAIHIQFFGFLPRMLLGVAFGYIYFWTGNLSYAIFAHFLNNAYVVCVAYYLQQKNLPFESADEMPMAWYGYLISAILTLALFKFLKDSSTNKT